MFNNITKNTKMLEGSYKKLKSYYYYNKNFIVMREKIVLFESSEEHMNEVFKKLATSLSRPTNKSSIKYFENLISKVDFYSLPKKFEASKSISRNKPISNTLDKNKKMKSVNFFIDMPIELHILDTLWTLFISKSAYDLNILSDDVYGNTVMSSIVSSNTLEDNIHYNSRRLFNLYFYQYTKWRNNAFAALEKNFDKNKNSLLVSLDLQSYFYTIKFDFNDYSTLLYETEFMSKVLTLTYIMKKVFVKYKDIISSYRKDLNTHANNETPLPIGLFSSMVLGNIYLSRFDKQVSNCKNISYYGRYVDDLMFVFDTDISPEDTNDSILIKTLVQDSLFNFENDSYRIKGFDNLTVQKDKIKLIYIDHTESRAIIDIYNENIKIIPSQTDPLPNFDLDISYFSKSAYSVDKLTKQNKIRELGDLNIDSYNISLFFSNLIMKYSRINSFNETNNYVHENIMQINDFFTGTQCIEYYSNWMNYIYFLVITQRHKDLKTFCRNVTANINSLTYNSIDSSVYKKASSLNKRAKDYLKTHLKVCLSLALCLDYEMAKKNFQKNITDVSNYIHANIFNHNLVAFPLSNYLNYKETPSYLKMEIKDIGEYSKIEDNFKFKWSPRFIHYDELLLLVFYNNHNSTSSSNYNFINAKIMEKFMYVNDLQYLEQTPFNIEETSTSTFKLTSSNEYFLRKISIPRNRINSNRNNKFNISVASLKLNESDVILDSKQSVNRWKNISLSKKKTILEVISDTYKCTRKIEPYVPSLLIFPELSIPVYWIYDLIKLSKSTQIGIIAGVQYVSNTNGRAYNYILTIFPFQSDKYKNAFFYIREKNDYSPGEKIQLAKSNYYCLDTNIADYQIFNWNNIDISAFVCYEFTDIFARALLKGQCDIIAAPVFNQDTTYFSNIIDSSVRDLHAFFAQSNTSIFGDSRVTGPYDRDHKDIFKIKGGENDNVLIGSIDFASYYDYQRKYYPNLQKQIEDAKKHSKSTVKYRSKPDIKPLSARFKNTRTNNNS